MIFVLYFTCISFVFFAVTVCECNIEIMLLTYLLTYIIPLHFAANDVTEIVRYCSSNSV